MELPLGIAAETFRLEKAVCSHGLFMMAPNYWDPLSKTLTRPLRLSLAIDDRSSSSSSDSVIVSISQLAERPGSLNVRVHGVHSISSQQEHALLGQVSRMLRLSETEEKAVREFRSMSSYGDCGRVFRSPTLFEDMIKCILLCNCQWSRTLSMAQALCELQLELQKGSSHSSLVEGGVTIISGSPKVETKNFIPNTPARKESRKKKRASHFSTKVEKKLEFEDGGNSQEDHVHNPTRLNSNSTLSSIDTDEKNACQECKSCKKPEYFAFMDIGNFPSPEELANLDERFLAKRCNLGYRASRILKLAQAIVDGRIQLTQLEELSKDANLSNYNQLADHLKEIEGFGPFTCANVLMSELWEFYETRFGKMNEMACSDYKLITASNMRSKGSGRKRKQIS
ncbi:uncharacterized protein G2W53_005140 [Senna tora]|uniref:HhH-GPD domain-containing protein n=1 Tax=Senna tora TaxID=362788 RepID=A0A834XEJ7_9FABA|nr:uncharacterized protein G2W53_005140 [Senna tora]